MRALPVLLALIAALSPAVCSAELPGKAWQRHVIDGSSKGADGVKLADVNGDGLLDIVTGWEEGGTVRLYRNPGSAAVRRPWPAVTVGSVPSVEDALPVDLDGDGRWEILSSAEGRQRSLQLHRPIAKDIWNPENWLTETIAPAQGRMMWMFAAAADIDGNPGLELLAGGKNSGAQLGWWSLHAEPQKRPSWRWHPLRPVGWVMSIVPDDIDGDGDIDLLFTDRKGGRSGCFWLENPGVKDVTKEWKEHPVAAMGEEAMFLARGDLDKDGWEDIVVAVRPDQLVMCRRLDGTGRKWSSRSVSLPDSVGGSKGIAVGDINGDGRADLVGSCEGASPPKSGVFWMEAPANPWTGPWKMQELSGPAGVKFDLVELLDMDGDGDLDVLTCEERENLGVIWYENPVR